MRRVVCDIEADSLKPTKIWCVVAYDIDENKEYIFTCKDGFEGFQTFAKSVERWIGHNFLTYDMVALNKLLQTEIKVSQVLDTLVLSRLFQVQRPKIPGIKGCHSLKYWGRHFGQDKVEHEDWSQFSPEMLERCRVDVQLNVRLYYHLKEEGKHYSNESVQLEHQMQYLLMKQKERGVYFDQEKAHRLYANCRHEADEIAANIHLYFKPKPKLLKAVSPKFKKDGTMSVVGIKQIADPLNVVAGEFSFFEWEPFNLNSPKQVVERLNQAGWQPTVFNKATPKMKEEGRSQGSPKICEENLNTLPDTAPESAKLIAKYLLLDSRCKNVKTWFEALGDDGRIHGDINSLGASTHRCSHDKPNTANIPAVNNRQGKPALYGRECRECFTVSDKTKRVLVGVDAEGIQLRILAHYMNDRAYTFAVVSGKKEDGTDIHTVNQKAGGFATREISKTFIYAYLLGAGDAKVKIITGKEGKAVKQQFLESLPALARVKKKAEADAILGYMTGIDGRRVQISSAHKALSVYLQAGEAIIMKKAYVLAYKEIARRRLDADIVLFVHDEFQIDCAIEVADEVGKLVSQAIVDAGEYYRLRCPMAGKYAIADTWAGTH